MFDIHWVPIYNDNYVWILSHTGKAWVIDPGDHLPVLHFLQRQHLALAGILLTHRHWDHVTGVSSLIAHCGPGAIPVFGPDSPPLSELVTDTVMEGDSIDLGFLQAEVWATPGHTLDHLSYYFANQNLLFCGDTLFACGCGRLFDGSMEQLQHSLERIASLPANTAIYCTHEYTLANMAFALAVEPQNPDLQHRLHQCRALRAQNKPTLPTYLHWELACNPFLRAHIPAVQKAVSLATDTPINHTFDCFSALRNWKNRY